MCRSCRKLSVLPEEETVPEEMSPPTIDVYPSNCRYQAHSFESYLLPVTSVIVRRQLSDPTPSPDVHPASRRSSRSTCRPLQLQPQVFRFPDITPQGTESVGQTSSPSVKFRSPIEEVDDDFLPRITSPTFNILKDTVSHLITMSTEALQSDKETDDSAKKDSLSIPAFCSSTPNGTSPFKTPPDSSLMSTPGFFTPQEFTDRRLGDSSSSSSFQTTSNASPETSEHFPNGDRITANYSDSSNKFPVEVLVHKVPHLGNAKAIEKLSVGPMPGEFHFSRTMMSILFDEPKERTDKNFEKLLVPPIPVSSESSNVTPRAGPSSDASLSPGAEASSDTALSPGVDELSRTPSRRRLQRSLVRISSETPLQLVPAVAR